MPDKSKKNKLKTIKNSSSLPALKCKAKIHNSKMINIFDQGNFWNNNSTENLDFPNQLENKMRTLMDQNSIDSDTEAASQIYASSSSLMYNSNSRKMALQHLRPKRENYESSRDFVINSRKILKKEISIQDKIEETQRLEGKI